MPTLFDATSRKALLERLARLEAKAPRQWGKMDPAQALTHCALALEMTTGEGPGRQKLIGKLLAPLVLRSSLGERPFGRGAPTDPTLVVSDARDFAVERERLRSGIGRFVERGPAEAGRHIHPFFGRLTGDQWGILMHKHIDHHLRQFGA